MTHDLLRLATAGSVDDGKSTLVGRLLYDTKSVLADQLDAVERVSKERGLEGADLAQWGDFRNSEDSRYVSLVLPRAMLRLPYGEKTLPADGFNYDESVLSEAGLPDNANFLWGNAAYFLAERITKCYRLPMTDAPPSDLSPVLSEPPPLPWLSASDRSG